MKKRTLVLCLVLVVVTMFAPVAEAQGRGGAQEATLPVAWVIGLGAVGALAPDIIRLYNLRTDPSLGSQLKLIYFIVSLLMAALGGLVALILPATTMLAAFYAGIGTPAIIATARRAARSRGREEDTFLDEARPHGGPAEDVKKYFRAL